MKADMLKKPWKRLYLLEIVIIVVSLCLMSFGDEIWYDEVFSVAIVKHSFPGMIAFTAADVHPPLYYFVLKLFTIVLGQRMCVYHLASIVPFVLMLLCIGKFVDEHFGEKEAALTVLLVTGAPNMIMYAVEIRMYSLACLFVVLSMITALKLQENPGDKKQWGIFAVVNVLAAYTHYFAGAAVLLVAGCLFLYLVTQKEGRKRNISWWFGSMVVTGVLYLPWLPVFYRQLTKVKGDYWIKGFSFEVLLEYGQFVFGKEDVLKILAELLFLVAVCVIVYFWKNEKKDYIFFLNGFVFFGFIASGILLSILVTPVFFKRYIVIVLPLFWIVVACALLQTKNRNVFLALGCISLVLFSVNYEKEFSHRNASANTSMLYLLQDEMEEGDVIYNAHCYLMADVAVYFPERESFLPKKALKGQAFTEWGELTNTKIVKDAKVFCDEGYETVWLLEFYRSEKAEQNAKNVKIFEQEGYEVEDKGNQTVGWGDGSKDCLTVRVYKCTLKE